MKSFVVAFVISLGFLTLTVVAIRRKRLRDQAAVLWLGVSLFMVVCSIGLPFHLLDRVAHGLGIAYGSDLLLLLAVIFLIILVFFLSVNLAAVKSNQTRLVQELALLRSSQADSEPPHPPAEITDLE
jgi:hypothetical protein